MYLLVHVCGCCGGIKHVLLVGNFSVSAEQGESMEVARIVISVSYKLHIHY